MDKILIYSCVFLNEKYIQLLYLLLKSYKVFGGDLTNIDYLVMCNVEFKDKIQTIFDSLNITGNIWCLNIKTIFASGCSRLKIFDYENIDLYDKILYLDCDILITNPIKKIFNFTLEDKLYTLQERANRYYHLLFFSDEECLKLHKTSTFTSGILLFNNNEIIKNLFLDILQQIKTHIIKKLPIPEALDQPFIVFHAVKKNLFNNQRLKGLVINNPKKLNGESICHFPGDIGNHKSKLLNMKHFIKTILLK